MADINLFQLSPQKYKIMWSALQIMANVLYTAEKVGVVSYAIFNILPIWLKWLGIIWLNLRLMAERASQFSTWSAGS